MSYIVLRNRWCHTVPNRTHQMRRKVTNQQTVFMRNLSRFPIVFPMFHMKILLRDFNAKLGGERAFLNWLLGMRFYIRTVTIMFLQQWTVPHQKFWLFRARCSHTKTFLNIPGPLLMGRLTTRLITYWQTGDVTWVYSMYDLSRELTVILNTIWQMQKLGKDWQ